MKPFYLVDIRFVFLEKTEKNGAEPIQKPINTESCSGLIDHWNIFQFYLIKIWAKSNRLQFWEKIP